MGETQYFVQIGNKKLALVDNDTGKVSFYVAVGAEEAIRQKNFQQQCNPDVKVDYVPIMVEKPTVKQKEIIKIYQKWFGKGGCKPIDIENCSRQEAQVWIDKYKDSYWMQVHNFLAVNNIPCTIIDEYSKQGEKGEKNANKETDKMET